MSVTTAEVAEYDRFGPWIDEIVIPEDVPRLFRSYPIDLGAARMVLKVPRGIARRDATAGMDLYDHLVILDRDSMTLLSRDGATATKGEERTGGPGYDVLTLALADVVAIRDDLNLLDGRVTVSTSTGASISVPYNGSAHDMATRLVNELRAVAVTMPTSSVGRSLLTAGGGAADVTAVSDPGSADTHLVSRFLELRNDNPDLVVLATHGRRRVSPGATGFEGFVARLAHVASPATLHGVAVVMDANALEFLGRRASLVRGRNPDYSSSRLVVPLGALDSLELSAHPVYPDAATVTIGAGQWATDIHVPSGSDAERLFLTASPRVMA
jgi:hypothetical protein